jgi:hypothetical protein
VKKKSKYTEIAAIVVCRSEGYIYIPEIVCYDLMITRKNLHWFHPFIIGFLFSRKMQNILRLVLLKKKKG